MFHWIPAHAGMSGKDVDLIGASSLVARFN